jgi:hypothetical protein
MTDTKVKDLTVTIDESTEALTWAFRGQEPIVLRLSNLAESVRDYAVYHGLKQRCGDKAALAKGSTLAEKAAAVRELVDHYNNGGAWELPRNAAGPRGVNHAMLVEAMQRALGVGFAKADSLITGMAVKRGISIEDARKVWSEAGDVKAAIAAIRAEMAAKSAETAGVSADSLMAEMDADD